MLTIRNSANWLYKSKHIKAKRFPYIPYRLGHTVGLKGRCIYASWCIPEYKLRNKGVPNEPTKSVIAVVGQQPTWTHKQSERHLPGRSKHKSSSDAVAVTAAVGNDPPRTRARLHSVLNRSRVRTGIVRSARSYEAIGATTAVQSVRPTMPPSSRHLVTRTERIWV